MRVALASESDEYVNLRAQSDVSLLLPKDLILLEIKTAGAMPIWLSSALDGESILPGSFSKYGAAYTRCLEKEMHSHRHAS